MMRMPKPDAHNSRFYSFLLSKYKKYPNPVASPTSLTVSCQPSRVRYRRRKCGWANVR